MKQMIMKRAAIALLAAVVMMPLVGCNEWLEENYQANNVTRLSDDVEFVATSATCRHLTGVYAEFKDRENFFLELLGDAAGPVRDAMILDLLTPKGATSPEGVYQVGYVGDYVALSRYDIRDENTGIVYYSGCYYGQANNGYIGNYYGFLTLGSVTVEKPNPEEDIYNVVVDAYSGDYSIKVTYKGALPEPTPVEK